MILCNLTGGRKSKIDTRGSVSTVNGGCQWGKNLQHKNNEKRPLELSRDGSSMVKLDDQRKQVCMERERERACLRLG